MDVLKAIWAAIAAWWAALKGFRSYIAWAVVAAISALLTAAAAMDWAQPLRDLLPNVPAPIITLLAATLGIFLRTITTTPPGKKENM